MVDLRNLTTGFRRAAQPVSAPGPLAAAYTGVAADGGPGPRAISRMPALGAPGT